MGEGMNGKAECEAVQGDLPGYLEWMEAGRAEGFAAAHEHVGTCEGCAAEAAAAGAALEALRRAEESPGPEQVLPEPLEAAIARALRRDARVRRVHGTFGRAAAAVLLVGLGLGAGLSLEGGRPAGHQPVAVSTPSPAAAPEGPAAPAPAEAPARLVLDARGLRDLALFRLAAEAAGTLRGDAAAPEVGPAAPGARALAEEARRLAALYAEPAEAQLRSLLTDVAAALDGGGPAAPERREALADALEGLRVRFVLPPRLPMAEETI